MKRISATLLTLLFGLLATNNVHAQTANPVLEAMVPFHFQAANKNFPAGHYALQLGTESILLRNKKTGAAAIVVKKFGTSPDSGVPRLRFTCVNSQPCTLSQVWSHDGMVNLRPPAQEEASQTIVASRIR
ncbi:MAG: hypothetical protein AB7O65_08180 [Candidatus Korobacteraceae bacterium]